MRKGVVVCLRGGAVSPMFLPHLQITIPKEGDAPKNQKFYTAQCALLTHELEKQCRDGNFANMAAATLSSNPYATADAAKKARLDARATVLQARLHDIYNERCAEANVEDMAAMLEEMTLENRLTLHPDVELVSNVHAQMGGITVILQYANLALVCLAVWDTGRTHIVREDRN